jgi:hypothetical protein
MKSSDRCFPIVFASNFQLTLQTTFNFDPLGKFYLNFVNWVDDDDWRCSNLRKNIEFENNAERSVTITVCLIFVK